MKKCLLFVAHGSRLGSADEELQQLIQAYRQLEPMAPPVYWGYVEISLPNYQQVLADLAKLYQQITVVPLALFASGHVKNDIPLAVSRVKDQFPEVKITVTRPLGVNPGWIAVVEDLLAGTTVRQNITDNPLPSRESTEVDDKVLVVIGRGSSDPDANSDFFKICRLIGEGLGIHQVIPCFIGITGPTLPESLQIVARLRPKRTIILPFLLFTGRLVSRIEDQIAAGKQRYPWLSFELLAHLSSSPLFLQMLHQVIAASHQPAVALPCVSCQYRIPLGRIGREVGGLRSLLWSLRHSLTHSQAVPHTHAHRNLRKHVLVCTNGDCVDRGALGVLRAMRRELRDQGLHRDYRVTRTSCLGRCGEGPTVAVYPDGIWYRQMDEAAGRQLVTEHLQQDRLLGDYVDNIMT